MGMCGLKRCVWEGLGPEQVTCREGKVEDLEERGRALWARSLSTRKGWARAEARDTPLS